ncbi:uncharacterized protein phf11 isoform X2 [Parambassis ranga]|nr:PHD finger protein 11 isoform X2 [Parambassis ranga]
MDEMPRSDALCDSSDDDNAHPSTSKSEIASRRPKRSCRRPKSLVEKDNTSEGSEEEYVPHFREESTDSDSSMESKKGQKDKVDSTSRRRTKSSSRPQCESRQYGRFETEPDSTQRFPIVTADADEDEMVEEPSVYVNPALKKEDGSRSYDKKHYCFYCGRQVQKMSRHLIRKHCDKAEVAKALSLPKNSKERRLQLDYIRNKGNFEHNIEVLESHRGKMIPWKQPKEKMKGQEFTHCVYCYGLFTRKVMWRHFQVCKFKPQGESSQGKTRVQALCAFAERAPLGLGEAYWKFVSDMNQDDIAVAIKEDPCILKYGYRLFNRNERVTGQHQRVRQKLRELGRLLLHAKKVAPVKTVRDLIKPENYSHVVSAARSLAGFNDKTGKFHRPSLARTVGHSLRSLAIFIKSEGLKTKDKQAVQHADEFAQLYQESWKFDIASQALTQLDQPNWNSPQLLPFTQDVQNLHCFLSEKQQQRLNTLTEEPSPSNWKDLAKVTLAQVILFNRRGAAEVSRTPLSVYLSKDTSETHDDVNLALTALEQKLCKHFVRITIVEKRGRKVPVLLTPLMRESLDALTEKREECGVLDENRYLFALPQSVHYLRGSDCMRQLVNECNGIKNPKELTSTKLRKHVAALSTVLNLKTTDLDQLADFLGHNIEVHRTHYRLPEGTLQLAKISKVLLAMEQGRLGEYKGKSLDEIHLDVNETAYMERCSQEDAEDMDASEDHELEAEDNMTSLQEGASVPHAQGSEDESTAPSLLECASAPKSRSRRKGGTKRERNGHASAETSNHRAPSKERCSTCERTEGNTVTVYCDKHAASSSHRKATDGGGPPPGRGSACSGGSSSRTSTRRSSSKRRLRVCDTQAENPSKRRPDGTRWNRIESDGSSTDLDDPNPDMALFAPLESDLEESASEQDAESDSLLPVVTCVISQAPQTVPQEQVVQQKTETTSSPPYSHVSETESLMLPVEICIDSEILLESNTQVEPDGDVSESERPLPPVETCMDAQSLTSPQPFTQIVSPAAEAAEGEHGGSSLFVPPASPRSRPGSPPCTSSNMSSGAPETSHVTPPSAGPPAGLTSDPQPSTDSVSFWKSCNAAGCTEAMFSDFISEMKSIYSRILSDEASQQDCDVALAVMEASGNLAALVAKQQKELQKKQLELQKAAAAMRNIVSALKR